jgi:hypothetical protein
VIKRLDGKRHASRQVPAGIRLADIDFAAGVHSERTRLKREHPDRSDAEISQVVFSAILDLMGDPTWEGVQ